MPPSQIVKNYNSWKFGDKETNHHITYLSAILYNPLNLIDKIHPLNTVQKNIFCTLHQRSKSQVYYRKCHIDFQKDVHIPSPRSNSTNCGIKST